MIPNASPSTRRTASYWALALVLGLIALLPSTTEGVAAAYGAFILGFVLTALVAAIAERRWHATQKDFPVPSLALAGVVLVVTGAGVPVLEAGAMGVVGGAGVGLAGMVLIQEGFRAAPDEAKSEDGSRERG